MIGARQLPWANGSSSQWRTKRAEVLNRDGMTCQRCFTVTHDRRCSSRGCGDCAHVHHLFGTRHMSNPHDAPVSELTVWCARCNLAAGDPTKRRRIPAAGGKRLMAGVRRL